MVQSLHKHYKNFIDFQEVGIIKVVTVMDSLAGEQKAMKVEHGLSFYAETGDMHILFDFGAGRHALENALRLGIRPERTNIAVGSHRHYDHAVGCRDFAAAGLNCPLVTGDGLFEEKYARNGLKATYLGTGFDSLFLEEHGIRHMVCESVLPIGRGCWVMGGIRRSRDFETVPERSVIRDKGRWKQDCFQDEVCLVLEERGELVAIAGCSHPDILSILDTVRQRFSQPTRAVVGGTHLVEADRERIHKTIHTMKELGIGLLGSSHCSGELLRGMMAENPELDIVYLGVSGCLFLRFP